MKKKVLHIINSLTLGGAEVLLTNSLADGGLNEFTENWLVFLKGVSPALLERVDTNVKVIDLEYKGIADLPRVLMRIRKLIKEKQIDIVHSHLNPAGLYSHLACPAGIPHVHTIHAPYSMDTETNRKMLLLEKYLYLKSKDAKVICVSEFTRNDFIKAINFTGETFVLNNFVADNFFVPLPKIYRESNVSLKFAAAGTLKELKNFEYLLDVFNHLKDYNITLDIYGKGDTTPYDNFIAANRIKVSMKGSTDNMADVLKDYDIFVVPSKFESFSLAGFEAMASGLPVIVSDIPPLKNIMLTNAMYLPLNNALLTATIFKDIFNGNLNIDIYAQKGHEFAKTIAKRNLYNKHLLEIYKHILN